MAVDRPDPMYKYVDDKVRTLRNEIRQYKKSLLETQRFIAKWLIILTHNDTRESILAKGIKGSGASVNELLAESAEALTEANKSKEPLSVAVEFSGKCADRLSEFGIKGISAAYWF